MDMCQSLVSFYFWPGFCFSVGKGREAEDPHKSHSQTGGMLPACLQTQTETNQLTHDFVCLSVSLSLWLFLILFLASLNITIDRLKQTN